MTEYPQIKALFSAIDLMTITGLSRTTIWRNVRAGTFPKPIRICGSTRWRRAEIEAPIGTELDAVDAA